MVLAGEVTLTLAFCAASSPTSRSTLSLRLGRRDVPPAQLQLTAYFDTGSRGTLQALSKSNAGWYWLQQDKFTQLAQMGGTTRDTHSSESEF